MFERIYILLKFVLLTDGIAIPIEQVSVLCGELVEYGFARLISVAEVELLDLVHDLS